MPTITPRFQRTAVRTRTVTGTTSVGGTTSTVVGIFPDSTIRFVDRAGRTQVIQCSPISLRGDMTGDVSTRAVADDPYSSLFALVDVLIART